VFNEAAFAAHTTQVYTGLDIGTDKVSREIRERIPHHMIDIYPLNKMFSAGEFAAQSIATIRDVLHRGKVPIVVGLSVAWSVCLCGYD
jgi:tRNA dimethylallyltransferase